MFSTVGRYDSSAPNSPRSSTIAGAPVRAPGSPASASARVPSRVPATIAVSAAAERKLRGSGPAGLQDEDRPGEAEQAHPEVAPQPELVEQAQRLRNRLGERPRDLGMAVAGDGDEGPSSCSRCLTW